MPRLINKNGKVKEVSSDEIGSYLKDGFVFSPDEKVYAQNEMGEIGEMDALEASDFIGDETSGYSYVSPQQIDEMRIRQEQDTPLGQIQSAAEGTARALTFGGSDLILESMGVDPQGIQDRKTLGGSLAGEAAAFIAPWEKLGRVGKVAGAGIKGLDKISRKAAEKATGNLIKSKIGKGVTKGAVYGGVEGGLYEGAQGLSEQMLGDSQFNGEAVIARAKDGIKYGAGLGGLFGGIGGAVDKISSGRKVLDSNIKKIKDDVIPLEVSMESVRKNKSDMSKLPHVRATYDSVGDRYKINLNESSSIELDNSLDGFNILDMDNIESLDPIMNDVGFYDYKDYLKEGARNPQAKILNGVTRLQREFEKAAEKQITKIKREYGIAISKQERLKKGWNRLRNKKNKTKSDIKAIGKHRAAFEKSKNDLFEIRQSMAEIKKKSAHFKGISKNKITSGIRENFDAIKDGDDLFILKPEKFNSINNTAYKKMKGRTKLDKSPEAALSALGATRSTFKKLDKDFGAKRKARIADYAQNMLRKGKFFDGLDKYEDFVDNDISKSIFNMDNAIDTIDNYFERNNLSTGVNLKTALNEIKYKLKDDFSYPSGQVMPSKRNVLKNLFDEIDTLKMEDSSTIAGIREIRKKIDDSINWNSTPDEMSTAIGKRKIRKALEDEIIKTSDRYEELTEAVEKYKKAKESYSDALAVRSIIEYGQQGQMGNNNIALTSMILAGDIASTGSTIPQMIAGGAGAMAGREFLRRYGDKIMALHGDKVTKAANGLRNSIKKSTKAFLEADSRKIIMPSVAAFTPRELELRNLEDYQNYVYDIQPVIENFQKQNEHYAEHLPETAMATKQTMIRGMKFLNDRIPKNPYGSDYFKRHTPPEMEMRKFERYKNAVANPLNIIEEIKNGYSSVESIEVLREVYPSIYESLKEEFLEQLYKTKPDYKKRLQINKMFNIDTDYYLRPENIQILQQTAKISNQEQEASGASNQNAGKINKDERSMTDAQRVTSF